MGFAEMSARLRLPVAGLLFLALAAPAQEPRLQTWRLERGRVEASEGATDAPLAVGSLQKPFVARAWAEAHPGQAAPRLRCPGGGACWLKRGHGELGLATAAARSCNAYFRQMAEATPREALVRRLGDAGFEPAPATAGEAIGLAEPRLLRIRPSRLLEATAALLRDPWPGAEALRAELRQGLREGALAGTAGGLGAWGLWAKTGTVPLDAVRTEGFCLALDDGGFALLGRLSPGTGAQAAAALAGPLAALRPGTPLAPPKTDEVTVRLFDLLPATAFTVRNVGEGPVPDGRGFLGPGASRPLRPGDRVGPGRLELGAETRGLRRRFEGRLQVVGSRLLAVLPRRAYVEGVLAAELPQGGPALRRELGAAVLRFLARGRRHPEADVCDSTHCAWFVGQGPRLEWRRRGDRASLGHHVGEQEGGRRATEESARSPLVHDSPARATALADPLAPLADADWAAIQARAQAPGPSLWTAHCGGRPLAERRLWGRGEGEADPCPRHPAPAAPWIRTWARADLARAFGPGIESAALAPDTEPWALRLTRAGRLETLSFDQAHRRIAAILSWDALPAPAHRATWTPEGLRLEGVGSGHRVGLCLGE